jgi:GNAT superfamily N-acetyltransferase
VIETNDQKVAGAIFWYKPDTKKQGHSLRQLLTSGLIFFPFSLPLKKMKRLWEYEKLATQVIQKALDENYHVLDYMAIAKEYQGHGAGSILVQTEYDFMQKQFVFTSFKSNIRFYERNGYILSDTYDCFDGAIQFYALKHDPN